MPADVEPPELARLLDTAERSRVGNWSLRSALARYAQSEPRRVAAVLEVLRRTQAGLRPHTKRMRKEGAAVWAAFEAQDEGEDGDSEPVVPLLRSMAVLDGLGDSLASWAADPTTPRPDDEVDAVVNRLSLELDELGIPREHHEDRARGPRRRRPG